MKKQDGFTLIELLVSMLIMGLALGGAFAMQNKLAQSTSDTSHLSQGVFLASELIESMSANPSAIRFYQRQSNASNPCRFNACRRAGADRAACRIARTDVRRALCPTANKQSSAATIDGLDITVTCGVNPAVTACNGDFCGLGTDTCQDVNFLVTWNTRELDAANVTQTATVSMSTQL